MPFGDEITVNNTLERKAELNYAHDDITQKFTTYEHDDETVLDFAQARMHNFNIGRFTSPDPLLTSGDSSRPQSWNRYVYVENNPLNLTDPSGLLPCFDARCSSTDGNDRSFAPGEARYESIQNTGYDPEFRRFRTNVRVQILDSEDNDIVLYDETLQNPTLAKVQAKTEEFNQGIYRNQVRERLKARGLQDHITIKPSKSGYGFIFEINENSKTIVEDLLNDKSKFNSSGNSFYFGFHKKEAKCDIGGGCIDYRSIDGKGSDQFVYHSELEFGYVDTDKFNPRRSIGGYLGHAFLEVLPNTIGRTQNVRGVTYRGFDKFNKFRYGRY